MTPDTEPSPEARVTEEDRQRIEWWIDKLRFDAAQPHTTDEQAQRLCDDADVFARLYQAADSASSPPTGEHRRCPKCGSYERDICRHGGKASSAHILGPKMLHPKPCCDDPFHDPPDPAPTEQRTERDDLAERLKRHADWMDTLPGMPPPARQDRITDLREAASRLRSTPPNEEGTRVDAADLEWLNDLRNIALREGKPHRAEMLARVLAALSGEGEKTNG